MKRWLGWFLLAVGIGFLLWIPHRPVSVSPCAGAVLHTPNELVSNWCRALRDAGLALAQSRAGSRNLFATALTLLTRNITDEDGPPWLDYRGPPGRKMLAVTVCLQFVRPPARQAKRRGLAPKFRAPRVQIQPPEFFNTL
jgi:hypothetical protein